MSWMTIIVLEAVALGGFLGAVLLRRRRQTDGDLEQRLLHDDLTKLPNRALFRDRLAGALARSVRQRRSCAVLSIDIDRFKLINDGLGPGIGDLLLRDAGERLDACLRPEDTVARTGGDEFMVLIEGTCAPDEAVAVAERITHALAPPCGIDGRELWLTVSIGIALGRGGRHRPEDVLQNADVAVHRAKDNGRACYEIFRQEMNPHPLKRLGLEAELRRAVDREEFFLEYQPMVNLTTGEIEGVEALVRWQHPDRGQVAPLDFVPIAEETGLILPLGRWVLQEACSQVARLNAARGDDPLTVCVNLSPRQLQEPHLRLVDEVSQALANSGLASGTLCLEITESAVMQDVAFAVETLGQLVNLGINVALDDFGTGYSSLGHLRQFPLDIVKIDRSFVGEMPEDREGQAIVRALIQVCHALGTKTVAEGIEQPPQAKCLQELGCDIGQGNALSPPLGLHELEPLLTQRALLLPGRAAA